MTAAEPVSTTSDEHPWLESYPRWVYGLFVFGPLIIAGYLTPGVGWVVGMAGVFAAIMLGRILCPPALRGALDRIIRAQPRRRK